MNLGETAFQRWQDLGPPAYKAAIEPHERAVKAQAAPNLARRVKFLTADGQTATRLEHEALLGTNDLVEANFIDRCRLVMSCVGRLRFITARGRGFATGFLIAPGLMMTNHHVFGDAAAATGATLEFGYQYDIAGKITTGVEFDLRPAEFFVADKEFDFAVVAVSPSSTSGIPLANRRYLRLNPETGKVKEGDFVTLVQHPDGLPMRIALRENEVTRAQLDEPVVWYQADTAHGSSGAPVFNDSFQIAALHSSGRIKRNERGEFALVNGGFAASLEGLGESDVVWEANVGIRVSRICERLIAAATPRSATHTAILQQAMQGGDVLASAVEIVKDSPNVPETATDRTSMGSTAMENRQPATSATARQSGSELVVPLQLRISVELGGTAAAPARQPSPVVTPVLEQEAFEMRIPVIHDGLNEREGFDRGYLELEGDVDVPMPQLTTAGLKVAAPLLDDSGHELKYHKFSVWMQKERRLALFTASNVDWRERKKMVDGKKTDRDTLAGFPPDELLAEQWVSDSRLAEEHQLPDVFYTEDRGAFDKGHLVRRDDVCWGKTFLDIQKGNGDTYHVTNCSPQTKPFNQGKESEENWGDLESHIQKATKKDMEKVVIYAGPIFAPDDRWFRGKDDAGKARVQIPSRYWKIVVSSVDGEPQAYGFILKQDVTKVTEEEFFVTDEWLGSMIRLSDLQKLLRGWISLGELLEIDQFDAVHA